MDPGLDLAAAPQVLSRRRGRTEAASGQHSSDHSRANGRRANPLITRISPERVSRNAILADRLGAKGESPVPCGLWGGAGSRWEAAMTTILPLSLIGTIAGFLLLILSQFPLVGDTGPPPSEDATADELVRQAADRFGSIYTFVIADVASFQSDPDYDKAEYSRQAVSIYAISILPEFRDFANEMRSRLDQATAEYEEETIAEP